MLTAHLLGVIVSGNEELANKVYDKRTDLLDEVLGWPFPPRTHHGGNCEYQYGLWWEDMLD